MKDLVFDEAIIKQLTEDESFIDTYLKSIQNEGEAVRAFALAHVTETLRRKVQVARDSLRQREFAVPSDWMGDRISLRDYLAGQALIALFARSTDQTIGIVSKAAYQLADAMIQAREKK